MIDDDDDEGDYDDDDDAFLHRSVAGRQQRHGTAPKRGTERNRDGGHLRGEIHLSPCVLGTVRLLHIDDGGSSHPFPFDYHLAFYIIGRMRLASLASRVDQDKGYTRRTNGKNIIWCPSRRTGESLSDGRALRACLNPTRTTVPKWPKIRAVRKRVALPEPRGVPLLKAPRSYFIDEYRGISQWYAAGV